MESERYMAQPLSHLRTVGYIGRFTEGGVITHFQTRFRYK